MRFFAIWTLGATLAVSKAVAQSVVNLQTKLPNNLIANRFILEFASASDLPTRDLEKRTPHVLVYASLQARVVSFQVDKEYNAGGLFIGAAITLKNANDVTAAASTPGIIAVRPVKALKLSQPVDFQVINDEKVVAQIDTESTHVMTGVDRVHAAGITGKGVKIGIIDTGIDYTHPLLGGGFGPGYKVAGGYDFVGDAYDGSNKPVSGPNPFVQCSGHGTHVAGIIGANPGNKYNISGVAYDAELYAYRVFGCSGFTTDDVVLEALLRGVSDGNHILTMSLGAADGWTESAGAVVASRIAATGKFVTTAAGNDGASGSWRPSSPGTGIDVIAVASVENTVLPIQPAIVGGVQHGPILYYSLTPLPVSGTLPIYATSKDTSVADDSCSPLPASTPDLSKYVVIIRRGTCAFVTKLANIAAKGGKVALIYDNGTGLGPISAENYTVALIQAEDGEFLVKQVIAGAPVTISFPQTGGSLNSPNPSAGLVSSFSSYGPTIDLAFKPVIAAPGGNILSTLPIPLGSFGIASGTSMSTPFAAGSIALLLQAKGTESHTLFLARTLFETTAKSVPPTQVNTGEQQTLSQQGSGLIQVYKAINTETVVVPAELNLNDTAHFQGSHRIAVTNIGSSAQSYSLWHQPAGTAMTVGRFDTWPNLGPVPLSEQYATVIFDKPSFTLVQYETAIIQVQIIPPSGIDPTKFPVYSGFIQIDGDTESLHVSYLGLAASLVDKQILDNTSHFFGYELPALLDTSFHVQTGPMNYKLTNGDAPALLYRLLFGTPRLQADLVKCDIHITTTLNARADDAEIYSFPQGSYDTVTSVPTVGNIFEQDYVARNSENPEPQDGYSAFTLTPTFSNGTTIPNGSYKLLLRALRVTADPMDQSKYESWLSPVINISA